MRPVLFKPRRPGTSDGGAVNAGLSQPALAVASARSAADELPRTFAGPAPVGAACWRPAVCRADLVVCAAFLACSLLLFRLSIFGGWTFVGDSDRLNTVMNIRLTEVNQIRATGWVSLWNDQMFMGYPLAGLHWMLAAFTPVPYLLALLPESALFHALDVFSMLLIALMMVSAYAVLRAYSRGVVPACVGGILYGLSSYVLIRIAQFDLSCGLLIIGPLMLRVIRETRRETAVRSFLWLGLGWAGLFWIGFLQETAYITMLLGAYAVFRAARLRDVWPLLVGMLAGLVGTVIGLPRVITVGQDIVEGARKSIYIQTAAIEALRFFGDGLLGRTFGEQYYLLHGSLNLHEGVQLLTSPLAALAALAVGLQARSVVMRALGIALVVVLTVALRDYLAAQPPLAALYGLGPGDLPWPSRELRVVLVHAVIIGLPLWLLTDVLAGRTAARERRVNGTGVAVDASRGGLTPDAVIDAPFMLGFVVVGLALIVVREASLVLYYALLKVDFTHARLSVALILPLAALVTMFLSRFLPATISVATVRWLATGLGLGVLGWVARESLVALSVANVGDVLPLSPWSLMTAEVVRVTGSLLVMAIIGVVALRRPMTDGRTVVGGLLATWMVLESFAFADFRLSGPQTRNQQYPFEQYSHMNAAPGLLRPPTSAERAPVRERLEADAYRTVLYQDRTSFTVLGEPHLAAFWDLRLIEGYPGMPQRLSMLPWTPSMFSPKGMDIHMAYSEQDLPWRLLAALNVKYLLVVEQSLWFNPAPGAAFPPVDPATFRLIQNPYPVTPRAFFVARVAPAGRTPRLIGDSGTRPPANDPPIREPARESVVEGLLQDRRFATTGSIAATFAGDHVLVRVDPSDEDRFLVLNEMYHPSWRAWIDGRPVEIYPTNVVMRGLIVPPGATTIELRYVPFLVSWTGIGLLGAGVCLFGIVACGLQRATWRPAQRAS
jgi:hypothetical protein